MCFQVTIENVGDVFYWDTVYMSRQPSELSQELFFMLFDLDGIMNET